DPAGIKALLEQLRSSQAWQESIGSGNANPPPTSTPAPTTTTPQATPSLTQPPATTTDVSKPSSSVADLLSQLNSSERKIPARPTSRFTTQQPSLQLPQPPTHRSTPDDKPATTQGQDLRTMSFQQALPRLTQLAESADFVATIAHLREEQKDLERQLWEERQAIHSKHENKVKNCIDALIGGGISQHEADMLNDAFRKELLKFDAERVQDS
ncbi:hypothetical protein P692DRAFT_201699392, partial [Suillus brevipes Sb2]